MLQQFWNFSLCLKGLLYVGVSPVPFGVPLYLFFSISLRLLSSVYFLNHSSFPSFLPSFLCLPLTPTVQCMLKLSLEGACIVPACEFLISSDMGPEDLASAFNAKAPCLCLWSWPRNSFASIKSLWCCSMNAYSQTHKGSWVTFPYSLPRNY